MKKIRGDQMMATRYVAHAAPLQNLPEIDWRKSGECRWPKTFAMRNNSWYADPENIARWVDV